MAKRAVRLTPYCRYRLVWYDFAWNEMERSRETITASEMVEAIERWNRETQAEARNIATICPDVSIPSYVSIEVVYVQEESQK